MAITKEFVQNVRGRLEAEPYITTARIARELGVSEVDVVTAMPVPMRKKARPQDLALLLAELQGQSLPERIALHEENVGYVWFIVRPDEEMKNRSVRFFDKQGKHLASLPLQGQGAELRYEKLTEKFGVTPIPRRRACRGCGKCRCGGLGKASGC